MAEMAALRLFGIDCADVLELAVSVGWACLALLQLTE